MKKKFVLTIFLLLFCMIVNQNNLAEKNDVPNGRVISAVTYTLSGGRLGDDLLSYLHAKWISYFYKIPLLYVPFNYSTEFEFHEFEPYAYEKYAHNYCKRVYFEKPNDTLRVEPQSGTLYVIGYFPETSICNTHEYPYFSVNWQDVGFKSEIRYLISPRRSLRLIEPPPDCMSVAVHVRRGSGYDHDDMELILKTQAPKFLTDEFYIKNIEKISEMIGHQKLYAFVFTDDAYPQNIVARFKKALKNYSNIEIGSRENGFGYDKNILEDLFSMIKFDFLIRSESHFAVVTSKIGNFKAEIFPHDLNDTVASQMHFI